MLDAHVSPDGGSLYLTGGDGPVRRFELRTGKELPPVADTDRLTDTVRASADGKRVVTRGTIPVTDDRGRVVDGVSTRELVVRDVAANKTLGRLDVGYPVDFRFAGPDAVIVLAAKGRSPLPAVYTLSRWDLATRRREWEAPAPPFPDDRAVLAASPDGKRFAVTDWRCCAHVYDAATGKPVVEPAAHFGPVAWVEFSPDGGRVQTAGPDGVRTWSPTGERKGAASPPELARGNVPPGLFGEHLVWVARSDDVKRAELVGWDRAAGAVGWRAAVDGPAPARVLTHDGKRCVAVSYDDGGEPRGVAVYDGPAGKKLHGWPLAPAPGRGYRSWPPLALSPDGAVLFVGGDGIAGLDVTTGKQKFKIDAGLIVAVADAESLPMAVSPDGARVAVAVRVGNDLAVRVFDVASGKKLADHHLDGLRYPALRFSPDGKLVAAWHTLGPPVVYDAESERAPRKLEGGNGRATAAAFSPDGASLVVGYQDGTALVWDLAAK